MKKRTLATLAFCLGASPAGQVRAAQEVDLQTLKILNEESVSYDEFSKDFRSASNGNYSNFSISDGNYSNFSISSANYSNFSISDGNYSNFSISDANYSNFSISGAPPAMKPSIGAIPAPIGSEDEKF